MVSGADRFSSIRQVLYRYAIPMMNFNFLGADTGTHVAMKRSTVFIRGLFLLQFFHFLFSHSFQRFVYCIAGWRIR